MNEESGAAYATGYADGVKATTRLLTARYEETLSFMRAENKFTYSHAFEQGKRTGDDEGFKRAEDAFLGLIDKPVVVHVPYTKKRWWQL